MMHHLPSEQKVWVLNALQKLAIDLVPLPETDDDEEFDRLMFDWQPEPSSHEDIDLIEVSIYTEINKYNTKGSVTFAVNNCPCGCIDMTNPSYGHWFTYVIDADTDEARLGMN